MAQAQSRYRSKWTVQFNVLHDYEHGMVIYESPKGSFKIHTSILKSKRQSSNFKIKHLNFESENPLRPAPSLSYQISLSIGSRNIPYLILVNNNLTSVHHAGIIRQLYYCKFRKCAKPSIHDRELALRKGDNLRLNQIRGNFYQNELKC